MKSAWLIIAVAASVFAGAGGGLVATKYLAEETKAAKTSTVETAKLDDGGTEAKDHTGEIARLQKDIGDLMVRLEKAESANGDNAALQKKYTELSVQLAEMKKNATVAKTADGTPGEVSSSDPVLAEKVEAIIAEREAAERAARDAEREKQMQEMITRRNTQILDKLSTELSLTEAQKVNVQVALDDYTTKRREVFTRGQEARTNGTEFDWQGEFKTVNDAAAEAVRAELSTSQVSTFNTLIGEGSLDDLAGGWGGMRGGNNGGGRTGGGNNGGRGGR
jgi:hypothetical protein